MVDSARGEIGRRPLPSVWEILKYVHSWRQQWLSDKQNVHESAAIEELLLRQVVQEQIAKS